MILVSMKRQDPILYFGSKQHFFEYVNFRFTRGGNHSHENVLQTNKQQQKAQEDEG